MGRGGGGVVIDQGGGNISHQRGILRDILTHTHSVFIGVVFNMLFCSSNGIQG